MPLSISEYRQLVLSKLGIELDDRHQDGLGEFCDADGLAEFCDFYLSNKDRFHPIQRAESLDQILGSLSLLYESREVNEEDLRPVREVVQDAASNPFAASNLLYYLSDHEPDFDPGDHRVAEWLRGLTEIAVQETSDLDNSTHMRPTTDTETS